jgi:hypothetical protein
MAKVRTPRAGCFEARPPSTSLVEVPCAAPVKPIPLLPRAHGSRGAGAVVGSTIDFSAQSVGTIGWVTGEFQNVNVTSETDSSFGADAYTIQLNSNPFPNAPQCAGAADPSKCQGWQQFVYQAPNLLIEYWLLDFGTSCPSDWNTFVNTSADGSVSEIDCWLNSDNQTLVGWLPPTELGGISMNVIPGVPSQGTQDDATLIFPGGSRVVSEPSLLDLYAGWTTAEYNVFGFGNGSQANFNDGATMDVVVEVDSLPYTSHAPACEPVTFTGETNNLNLETPCCAIDLPAGTSPQIRFTEATTILTPPTQLCPLYLNVNNTPLEVTQGGTSEAFVLMYGPWITQDEGNLASGIVVADDAPVSIQVAPGTTIDSAGAVNLTVSAPLGATVGSYQASLQVTDATSKQTVTATVPIEVLACTPPSPSICTASMCGIWNASDCGGVNCGSCGASGDVCSSGHCCPSGDFYNGTTCQPSSCPSGTSWCGNKDACLTTAQCDACPSGESICPATSTCMTALACSRAGGGGSSSGGCHGTNCM